jgi:uncharacterized protein YggU (UPF0235/DUF167 family)
VRVKPNARVPSVAREGEGYLVAVREPARENAANEAVRRALAAHFDVAPSRVRLLRGATSKIKTFEVDVERVR